MSRSSPDCRPSQQVTMVFTTTSRLLLSAHLKKTKISHLRETYTSTISCRTFGELYRTPIVIPNARSTTAAMHMKQKSNLPCVKRSSLGRNMSIWNVETTTWSEPISEENLRQCRSHGICYHSKGIGPKIIWYVLENQVIPLDTKRTWQASRICITCDAFGWIDEMWLVIVSSLTSTTKPYTSIFVSGLTKGRASECSKLRTMHYGLCRSKP